MFRSDPVQHKSLPSVPNVGFEIGHWLARERLYSNAQWVCMRHKLNDLTLAVGSLASFGLIRPERAVEQFRRFSPSLDRSFARS